MVKIMFMFTSKVEWMIFGVLMTILHHYSIAPQFFSFSPVYFDVFECDRDTGRSYREEGASAYGRIGHGSDLWLYVSPDFRVRQITGLQANPTFICPGDVSRYYSLFGRWKAEADAWEFVCLSRHLCPLHSFSTVKEWSSQDFGSWQEKICGDRWEMETSGDVCLFRTRTWDASWLSIL